MKTVRIFQCVIMIGCCTLPHLVAFGTSPGPPRYEFIDLGTLGGLNSVAYGINSIGQVVGDSDRSIPNSRAFLYSNGAMTDLGSLDGTSSFAKDINMSGQIVGSTSAGGARAFLYSG